MILFNIRDYSDFNNVFGLEAHTNGSKSRKNKILLQHIKNPELIRYCREHDDWSLLRIRSMAELKKTAIEAIIESGKNDPALPNEVELIGRTFWSSQYMTDEHQGVCEDYDALSVRYVNTKVNRVFKKKAGKFFQAVIKECELGKILSEQTITYLTEEFVQDWNVFTIGKSPEVELHVDDNFELIYDEDACRNFNGCSCMVGRNRHSFYEDSVDAKAAYLLDMDGYVLSRAIIFTDVKDETGKKWRLCERQYARESNEVLKRLLVDMLIKGDHIDGYKQIGAGCHDSRAFVTNDGSSLADKKFSIRCELGLSDTLSYQDSFKYYDYYNDTAYNYKDSPYEYRLDTTGLNLEGDDDEDDDDQEYDDFHDYRCPETRLCYYHGQEYYVDVDNLEEFVYVESADEYHHKDDCTQCGACGAWLIKNEATYNSEAEEYFCDDECEAKYIEEFFHYSEYDDAYFKYEDDVAKLNTWDEALQAYRVITISQLSLNHLIQTRQAFGAGDSWFILNETLALKQTA